MSKPLHPLVLHGIFYSLGNGRVLQADSIHDFDSKLDMFLLKKLDSKARQRILQDRLNKLRQDETVG